MGDLPTASAENQALLDHEFVSYCTGFKESAVRNYSAPHSDDIHPVFVLNDEDGKPIVLVHAFGDRDTALSGLMMMCSAFSAAEAVLCVDAHYTREAVNPLNGRPWDNVDNRMDTACDVDGACALGIITDCLAFTSVRRDGPTYQYIRPYHVHLEAGGVHWNDGEGPLVDTGDDSFHLDGIVVEAMRDFMAVPTLETKLAASEFADIFDDETPRLARLQRTLAVTRMFFEDDRFLVNVCCQDPSELELVDAMQGRWKRQAEAADLIRRIDEAQKRSSGLVLP